MTNVKVVFTSSVELLQYLPEYYVLENGKGVQSTRVKETFLSGEVFMYVLLHLGARGRKRKEIFAFYKQTAPPNSI